ncbi:MAG TPA: radical SAM protein [Peptococcaceae bacterium]|nr:MAG: Radical SAM domain protein [Clostridia bacterium 41_269]HBT20802.1 radical SAM protein [Peptococcaceae bacterium]
MSFVPAYLNLSEEELKKKIKQAYKLQEECRLCPRECGVLRGEGEKGACRAGNKVKIASYGPHFGEERPLVGTNGSGTIFFSHCNLECVFCQNYDISWAGCGKEISIHELAEIMIKLQNRGCHNINLVTPTHYVPQILEALYIARDKGLCVPLVYNCGGYESVETLKILDGVIDIYMPDVKYDDPEVAQRLSGVRDYPERVKEALKEMHRQVGELKVDKNGIAKRGLIIRHLVLPCDLAGTEKIMKFIAEELSPKSFVNIMRQYYPAHKAGNYPPLNRMVTRHEFEKAVEAAEKVGITPRS